MDGLAGESAVYSKQADRLSKILPAHLRAPNPVNDEAPTALLFNATPIRKVAEELAQRYKIKIILETGVDPALTLSLNTRGKSITEVMEEIKNQLPVHYEKTAQTIHIKAN